LTTFSGREKMNSGSPNRPTLVTAWPRKPNTRGAIVQRIQAVTKELESIQAELTGPPGESSSLFDDAEAAQALNGFKAELDQLRRILWFYVEEAANKPIPKSSAKPLHRVEQASPAQRKLALQSNGHSGAAEPAWFFDRLELVIESYMQKKPAAAETSMALRGDTKVFS
jgi:hypothetical protein